MITLFEILRLSLKSISTNGFRSFLTTLGITIGVASVIAVVAIGQGMTQSIVSQFEDFGTHTVTVRSYTTTEQQLQGRWNKLPLSDVDLLRQRLTGAINITPTAYLGNGMSSVSYRDNAAYTRILGTTTNYQQANHSYPSSGRFLTPTDEIRRRKVAVVGTKLIENLKLPEQPLGTYITLGQEWFKIVGVMESRGEILGFSQDDYVIIPFSTAAAMNGWAETPDVTITFNPEEPDRLDRVIERAKVLLRDAHDLKEGQEEDFKIETSEQLKSSFSEITNTVTIVLGGFVGISLLVGGIGIMNTMLMSVTERTREIGIAKALGATRQFILSQFLIEAMVLSLLGGILGVLIGISLGKLITLAFPIIPDISVPIGTIAMALLFSTSLGLLFGITPAARAAALDPIEALRHE